jgi:hypothetical protein
MAAIGIGPAGAATKTIRIDTTTCIDSDRVATVKLTAERRYADRWVVTKMAAKNPCGSGEWLFLNSRAGEEGTDDCCAITAIQGGGKITWDEKKVAKYGHRWHSTGGFEIGMDYEIDPACERTPGVTGTVVDRKNKVWWGGAWKAADRCY